MENQEGMTREDFIGIVKRHCESRFVYDNSRLIDDLELCSFDLMMIAIEVQKEYGANYSFQQAPNVQTVADFYHQFRE